LVSFIALEVRNIPRGNKIMQGTQAARPGASTKVSASFLQIIFRTIKTMKKIIEISKG